MRLLQMHSDFIEYEPIEKEIKSAEDIPSKAKVRLEDLVVVFIAVETGDDESVAKAASNEIKKYMDTVKASRLLVYPYAHLSSNLAAPNIAAKIVRDVEAYVKESSPSIKKEDIHRSPFGWTKSFNIKVKGHPLAENAKAISKRDAPSAGTQSGNGQRGVGSEQGIVAAKPSEKDDGDKSEEEDVTMHLHEHSHHNHDEDGGEIESTDKESTALKNEEKLSSQWYILQPGGLLTPVNEYKFKKQDSNLQTLKNYEISKNRAVNQQPEHVRLMKKMAIADYEPASDAGNMRFYPKGRLMKSLIEQYVTRRVMEYGGIEVETPIMYDSKHPSMESYFNRFPARQYNIQSDNKQLFLRFAACFGQFLIAKDMNVSYKHMPFKLYELTRYSFRREKSGELVGLRRLRAFTMPDCHAFCKDIAQAREEFRKRFELSISVLNALGLQNEDVEMAIRFTEDFWNENREFITELINRFGRPVLAEVWKERFFYFTLKWEFNYIDGLGKASALSTDQIDVENGKRYGIEFVDEAGTRKNPIILHNSPSGAIERVMYALMEKAAKVSKTGGIPSFPLWLSHTQVRIISVSKEHLTFCDNLLAQLSENQIRADLDDRDESVGKKIRESETEWIRYAVVIGDKEVASGKLVVRDRSEGKQREVTLQELVEEVKAQTKDKPYLPLNLPQRLSVRPQIMA